MNVWAMLGIGWAIIALAMTALWWLAGRRNAGYVDVAWSLGTGALAVGFALTAADGA